MGSAKRKRLGLGLAVAGSVQLGARIKVGSFPMKGRPDKVEVRFPAVLTTQEKYDVATALAKAAAALVAEADSEVDAELERERKVEIECEAEHDRDAKADAERLRLVVRKGDTVEIVAGLRSGQRYRVHDVYSQSRDGRAGVSLVVPVANAEHPTAELFFALEEVRKV